jgi:uridine phosphorylase
MFKMDDAIVRPKPLKGFDKESAIYIPLDTSSRLIWNLLKKKALKDEQSPFGHFMLLGNKTVLFQCIGAPSAVVGLERLIASGAAEILTLGFCGSLNPHLSLLDVISVEKALSEVGTSKHYLPRKRIFRSSSYLREKTERSLSERNLPFQRGITVSTDAPFRETRVWLEEKRRQGIDAVDMEAAAVLALGEYHSIPAAALMIVSDELSAREWKTGFRDQRLDERIREYFFPFIDE